MILVFLIAVFLVIQIINVGLYAVAYSYVLGGKFQS